MSLTVSVVITCHNYGRYLRECLESVLAQERRADEILVVDDASTDDTPAIAAAYADLGVRYERVEYRNACRSYNHGIAATSGDLIAFADADNALLPRFLGTLAAALEAEPGLGFAYADRYWAGEATATAWADLGVVPGTVFRSFPPDPAMLVHQNFIDTMSMVRRTAVEAVGGFRDIPILWDYQLWLAILESGWEARYVPEPLYHYRVHGNNMIVATRPQHRGCALLIRREHFGKPFWAPYLRPELGLECVVVPGQPLPGGTPCTLFLTPQVVGLAYPARVRLSITLPPGAEFLGSKSEREDIGVSLAGGRGTVDFPYPVPDSGAVASAPTVRIDLVVRQVREGEIIEATLEWDDIFETRHSRTARIDLPSLTILPPLNQAIVPGAVQVIRGQFGPGEWVSTWAAMPDGAPRPSVALPPSEADAEGTVRVDLRPAPEGFDGVVVQGELLRNQVVLVPQGSLSPAADPGMVTRGKELGRRALEQARRRRKPQR